MLINKTNLKFQKYKTDVPIIKFSLSDGSSFDAIVDTGSESTVIDKCFVKKHNKLFHTTSESKMSLIGITGDSPHIVEHISSTFFFEGRRCMVSGVTSDLTELNDNIHSYCDNDINVSVIIGCDMLNQLGAIIDFNSHSIKIKL